MDRMTKDILIAIAVIIFASFGLPILASLLAHAL
jgi:hypothetical protein